MPLRTVPDRGAVQQFRTTFRFDLMLLLALVIVLSAVPLPTITFLPLLDLVVMGVGIAFGRRVSILFAIVAIIGELVRVHIGADLTSVLVLATPLIAGLAGGYAGHRLREAGLAAERAARRAELLSVALMRLPSLESSRAIYLELPHLLSEILGFMHADVLAPSADGSHLSVVTSFGWTPPPDVRVPLRSVSGRALQQGVMQLVPNVAEDPDFVEGAGLGPVHSELALPIFSDGAPAAVLNLERADGPFSPEEVASLQALVQAVGSAIERVSRLERAHETTYAQDFLLDFSRQITDAGPPETLARRALSLLLPRIGADGGRIWEPSGRDLRVLAELFEDHAAPAGMLSSGTIPDEPLFIADSTRSPYSSAAQLSSGLQSLALLPLFEPDGRLHAVLEIHYYRQASAFPHALRQMLLRAAERLSQALQQSSVNTRLASLLEALHGLGSVRDTIRLPDLALATAVHLIPGTDAATLLLCEENDLALAAHLGYADAKPPHHQLRSLDDAQHWYGGETWQFLRGTPRLLGSGQLLPDAAERCSLLLPLVHEQEPIGLLILDSYTRPDAFSQISVSLAETFGMQLSVLLEQLRHRRALERAARTDALTGLANRRSFDERLQEEWQAAHRYGHPLSLVLVDLLGFKSVNDRNGHQIGDLMLVAVAQAMESVRRDGDAIFRWGGDEFAIVLTHADLPGAQSAATRYLDAIRSARVESPNGETLQVDATLGIATTPRNADSIEGLIKAADDRVFEAKRARIPMAPPPGEED